MKTLIVNADDYNLSPGVNAGIIEGNLSGVITSTSFLVNLPGFEQAARELEKAPRLGVGLHINLTRGRPVLEPSEINSLVDDTGLFLSYALHGVRQVHPQELEAEIKAQINRFTQLMGKPPDHLDSHHHIHARYLEVFVKVALQFALPLRSLDPQMRDFLKSQEVKTGEHFIADFYGAEQVSLENLKKLLPENASGLIELMCHPGKVDEELKMISSYTDLRERELKILTSPELKQFLAARQFNLATYQEI